MKTTFSILFLGALAASLPAATLNARGDEVAQLQSSLNLTKFVEPGFPTSLVRTAIREGSATVLLVVNPDGQLIESFVAEYTHPAFAEAVETAVRGWVFAPNPGLPTARRYNVRFDFEREGVFVVSDFQEIVASYLGRRPDEQSVMVCKMRDLDKIPDTVAIVVPQYPDALRQSKAAGTALVSFYIDEKGEVRVPVVVTASDHAFGESALLALKQWKFAPPTRGSQPTRVFAVQEFHFDPRAKAPPPAK